MKDLSGDGKVTQKDVLIGRGVIKKKAGGMAKMDKMDKMAKTYAGGGSICPTCPNPAKCKAAGKCMKAGMKAGGMTKNSYKKGGKVRGCGIAKKGVRKAKMR